MLKLAVAANIPIISVSTRDTINLDDVVQELTGKTPIRYDGSKVLPKSIYTLIANGKQPAFPLPSLWETFTKAESTLLVVNPKEVVEPMFDGGEVPVPRSLVLKIMKTVVKNDKKAEELVRGLGGCTIKEAAELCRLTMARDASLTPAGLMQTRREFFIGSKGLAQLDSKQDFYDPPKELGQWIKREKSFFLTSKDSRLRPRGLLFDGPPGTGKTAGAKFVAAQFGIPLYRLDIGGTKNKYVGNSETNLLNALSRVDQEEPCAVLIDEVEKVFNVNNGDISGVSQSMLSQLLWWLAEHKSRVLTFMTTNNAEAIPPELYREGRIDEVMYFGGLRNVEALPFVAAVLSTFGVSSGAEKIVDEQYGSAEAPESTFVSQAVLTQAAIKHVKQITKAGLAV
jgi:hypothetical protein